MGWGNCGLDSKGRKIGYMFSATCDHPGCKAKIDRGLGYACGGMHGTQGEYCEGYFCGDHMMHKHLPMEERAQQVCFACAAKLDEARAEAYREALIAVLEGDSSMERLKQDIVNLLLEWDEAEDIPEEGLILTEAQETKLQPYWERRAFFREQAAARHNPPTEETQP